MPLARSLPAPRPIVVVGRDFFFMLPAYTGSTFSKLNGPGPPTYPPHPLTHGRFVLFSAACDLFSSFFKKVLPALGRKHIFEDRPTTFCIKIPLFGSPKRKDKPCLGHFVRSYRSFARPIRILCASVAHQKSCSRLGPVHFSHPRADQRKRLYAMHMQFCEFRVPCTIFFMSFVLHTPFFPNFVDFFENVLPALGGKHNFERCINKKS